MSVPGSSTPPHRKKGSITSPFSKGFVPSREEAAIHLEPSQRAAGRLDVGIPRSLSAGRAVCVSSAPSVLTRRCNWLLPFLCCTAHSADRVTRSGARGYSQEGLTPPGSPIGLLHGSCVLPIALWCCALCDSPLPPAPGGFLDTSGTEVSPDEVKPRPCPRKPHAHSQVVLTRQAPRASAIGTHIANPGTRQAFFFPFSPFSPFLPLSSPFSPFLPLSPTALLSPSFCKGTGCPFSPLRAPCNTNG